MFLSKIRLLPQQYALIALLGIALLYITVLYILQDKKEAEKQLAAIQFNTPEIGDFSIQTLVNDQQDTIFRLQLYESCYSEKRQKPFKTFQTKGDFRSVDGALTYMHAVSNARSNQTVGTYRIVESKLIKNVDDHKPVLIKKSWFENF